MSYRSILVHVEASPEARPRLDCALALAEQFDALLTGCGCEEADMTVTDALAVTPGEVMQMRRDLADHNIAEAKALFERVVRRHPRQWVEERLGPAEALAMHARAADLIVTSTTPASRFSDARHDDPGLLVAIAGRPVLIVPPKAGPHSCDRVLVCWKDAREARRAAADAMPLLAQAKHVLVVEAAAADDLGEACRRTDEVAEWMRRHGAPAQSEVLLRDERRVGRALLDRAQSFDAGLIVAGGFGRSRLGEWVFGGVTQSLITQHDRAVLLSH